MSTIDEGNGEWRKNWPVVAAAAAGMMLGSLHTYSLGVMIAPLETEFAWSRSEITSGMLITSVISVVASPFMGMAVDRFGPRRIGLIGTALYCAAVAMLSLAGPGIWTWWLLWSFLGVVLLLIKPTVWIAAISSFFNKSRGLALAIILSSIGVSQALAPMVTYRIVEAYDWRTTYQILGMGTALLILPIIYLWFTSAQDKARTATDVASRQLNDLLPGLLFREGLRNSNFIRLAAAAFTMSIASTALTVNLVPILGSTGLSRSTAASIAGLSGVFAVVGRLSGGYLLDRFNPRMIGGVSVLLLIIPCTIMLGIPGSIPSAIISVIFIGLASGAEMDAISYLAGRCFGLRNFGALFGTLMGILTLGIGLGPTLANSIYDSSGSYAPFLMAAIPLSLVTSFFFFSIGPYPDFEKDVRTSPALHGN